MKIKKSLVFIFFAVIFVFSIGCSDSVDYKNIDAEEGKELIDSNEEVQLVDVRESYEYYDGHIEGSVLIPLGSLNMRMEELDKDKPVLLICRTGNRSSQAASFLIGEGFSDVYNLSPGVTGWPYGLIK